MGSSQHGVVMTTSGVAALLAQVPAGALIDRSTAKRATIIAAAVLVTASSLALPWMAAFGWVAATQAVSAIAGSVFAPAIAGISLGVAGPRAFASRMGRNETYNHAGNAASAILAGLLAISLGPTVVFYLMAVLTLASITAAAFIPSNAIDDQLARGLAGQEERPLGPLDSLRVLIRNRALGSFALPRGPRLA